MAGEEEGEGEDSAEQGRGEKEGEAAAHSQAIRAGERLNGAKPDRQGER